MPASTSREVFPPQQIRHYRCCRCAKRKYARALMIKSADVSSQTLELVDESFITTFDLIYLNDLSNTLSRQSSHNHGSSGTQISCCHLGAGKRIAPCITASLPDAMISAPIIFRSSTYWKRLSRHFPSFCWILLPDRAKQ